MNKGEIKIFAIFSLEKKKSEKKLKKIFSDNKKKVLLKTDPPKLFLPFMMI